MATDRRDFLRGLATGAMAMGAGCARTGGAPPPTGSAQVDRRQFGCFPRQVSIFGLGLGSAFTKPYAKDHDAGRELLLRALAHGIDYWDTARAYGPSEEIVGPVLKAVRERVFIASKSGSRTYDGFLRDLEESLRRLQTDRIDLYHLHDLNPKKDQDLDAIGTGAVKAARKAREEGMIGGFGVTGHSSPEILMECIRRWQPDAVQTIFPASRPDGGRYEDELLPLARERKLAVIAMKAIRRDRTSDLRGVDLIRYTMSLDGIHTTVVGLDTVAHLEENAAVASGFRPLAGRQRAALSREVQLALGDAPAPWDVPGYRDGQLA